MSKTLKVQNGDIVRSTTNAQYTYVDGREKVSQDVRETLTTSVNPITGLGGDLDSSVGQNTNNPMETFSYLPPMFDFQRKVTSALRRLMTAQSNYLFTQRTLSELISDFSGVQIWPIADDQRNFKWRVALTTLAEANQLAVGGTVKR